MKTFIPDGQVIVLSAAQVLELLTDQEWPLIRVVQSAYEVHRRGESSLPQSIFLRSSDDSPNRIIALPAYLGGDSSGMGLKWIASFPGNLARGKDRASAVIILNDVETGMPKAIIEGSIISARRTAASAALAARWLHGGRVDSVAVIGCGLINFEIQRFLRAVFPSINRLFLYDLNREQAAHFGAVCERTFPGVRTTVVADPQEAFGETRLVSLATTAARPHLTSLAPLAPGSTVLHVSLRDLSPEVILACDNVVDDIDHVCRAETSIHLAYKQTGSRDFIRCTLADVTSGAAPPKRNSDEITIFSPFGLGVLDIAVAEFVYQAAIARGFGTLLEGFLPSPWRQSNADLEELCTATR